MAKRERGGIRAYARHRGVTHPAVLRALEKGRIHKDKDGQIDFARADRDWALGTDLSKPRNSVQGRPKARAAAEPEPDAPAERNGHAEADGEVARVLRSYNTSRAAKLLFEAKLAELEYKTRAGQLVDALQHRAQIFALGKRTRDALLGIPDRLTPVLLTLGATDRGEVHRALREELERALAELAQAPAIRLPTG